MDTERPTERSETQEAERPECADEALARLGRIEKLLERIVEHMYQVRREEQTREFGLADIFAALAQVLAIAGMLGAVLALLKTQPDRSVAALSLMGATALQGLALTLFILKRRH